MKYLFILLFPLLTFSQHEEKEKIVAHKLLKVCEEIKRGYDEDETVKFYFHSCIVDGNEAIKSLYKSHEFEKRVLLTACVSYIYKAENFFFTPRKRYAENCLSKAAIILQDPVLDSIKDQCWNNKIDYVACLMNGPAEQRDLDENVIDILKEIIEDKPKCSTCPP
jgi:hypothetical protein